MSSSFRSHELVTIYTILLSEMLLSTEAETQTFGLTHTFRWRVWMDIFQRVTSAVTSGRLSLEGFPTWCRYPSLLKLTLRQRKLLLQLHLALLLQQLLNLLHLLKLMLQSIVIRRRLFHRFYYEIFKNLK